MYNRIPSIKKVPKPSVKTTNLNENRLKTGHNIALTIDNRVMTRKVVLKSGRVIPPIV